MRNGHYILLFSLLIMMRLQSQTNQSNKINSLIIEVLGRDIGGELNFKPKENITPYFYCNSKDYPKLLTSPKDKDGVVLEEDKYKPTYIFRSGMNAYRFYKETGDSEAKKHFLNQAQWLKENLEVNENNQGLWYFNHPKPSYFLDKKWPSALSQGMGIGLALMAYHETKEEEYLNILESALYGYLVKAEDGGFFRSWDDCIWFEEYPTENESRVLNGFLFSIAGLYNMYENTGNKLAKLLFEEAVVTLEKKIHLYDVEFISKYSLFEKPNYIGLAKQGYHKLHIWQLLWLHEITGKKIFYDYAKKFLEIQKSQLPVEGLKIERAEKITASSHVSKNVVDNVYDNKWSWGGVWNSYDLPIMTYQFPSPKRVFGFSLYYSNLISENIPFEVWIERRGGNKIMVEGVERVGRLEFTNNRGRKTYINTFNFENQNRVVALEIKFKNTNVKKRVTITETNVFVALHKEAKVAKKAIKKRVLLEKRSIK